MKRYFVTGIGTGVGKTLVSAILTEALQADYWKPVQAGTAEGTDTNTVASLITNTKSIIFNEACLLQTPASPHLAAARENKTISLQNMQLPASTNGHLIIEGAGGLLVPLNTTEYVVDMARHFDAEVILVCGNYLGCINHSLLSINYLQQQQFTIKGLVLNGAFEPLVRSAIIDYAALPVLAEINRLSALSKTEVKELAAGINTALF